MCPVITRAHATAGLYCSRALALEVLAPTIAAAPRAPGYGPSASGLVVHVELQHSGVYDACSQGSAAARYDRRPACSNQVEEAEGPRVVCKLTASVHYLAALASSSALLSSSEHAFDATVGYGDCKRAAARLPFSPTASKVREGCECSCTRGLWAAP